MVRFQRRTNELKTKALPIDSNGFVKLNEKIEMKTFFDVDKKTGKKLEKMATLYCQLKSGKILGQGEFNLTEYSNPGSYQAEITMTPSENLVGVESKIMVHIEADA